MQVKSQTAFIAAIIGTGIIALIWMSTLPARFAAVGGDTPVDAEETLTDDALSQYGDFVAPKPTQPTPKEAVFNAGDIRSRVDAVIGNAKQKEVIDATTAPSAEVTKPTVLPASDSNIGKPVIVAPLVE